MLSTAHWRVARRDSVNNELYILYIDFYIHIPLYIFFYTDSSMQILLYRFFYTDSSIQILLYKFLSTDSSIQISLYRFLYTDFSIQTCRNYVWIYCNFQGPPWLRVRWRKRRRSGYLHLPRPEHLSIYPSQASRSTLDHQQHHPKWLLDIGDISEWHKGKMQWSTQPEKRKRFNIDHYLLNPSRRVACHCVVE